MAGLFATTPDGMTVHVHTPDGEGSAMVGKRKYRWTFHKYLGPTFLRADGEILKMQPKEDHPIWPEFYKWLEASK